VGFGEIISSGRASFARARREHGSLDVLVRAIRHYGKVDATQLSGSVTYFAFLSFFPLLAVAFAVVGIVITVVPNAGEMVTDALSSYLPGLVGTGPGKINAEQIASAKAGVGIVGFLTLLYSAAGMASAMRKALARVFQVPQREQRNMVFGKLFDLATIALVGIILVVSVSASAVVTSQTGRLLRAVGIEHSPVLRWALTLLGVALGVAASALMLFVLYRLLPDTHLPRRSLWTGAVIAAFGLEVLKLLATYVIARVTGNPLYGTFAIVVALLVWINYFARLAMLGAAVAVARNRLSERDLLAAEAFTVRAHELSRTPVGARRVLTGLVAAVTLLAFVGRRAARPRRAAPAQVTAASSRDVRGG